MKASERAIFKAAYRAAGLAFDEAAEQRLDAPDELLRFLETKLVGADLVRAKELLAMMGVENPNDPEMASDAAIMRRRRVLYDNGKLGFDQLHAPIVHRQSEAERKRFLEMFPDAERIQG